MPRLARQLISACILLLILATFPSVSLAATAGQVQVAIDKARAFLLKQQHAGGQWELDLQRVGTGHDWDPKKMQGDTFGGFSALATYALLASGSRADDPQIVSAVKFLRKADIIGTYALGMRLQVYQLMFEQTGDPVYKALAQQDANHLIAGINRKGTNQGMWNYTGLGGSIDTSCSQFGVLGLWAAARIGANVNPAFWGALDQVWRKNQFPDGGWAYRTSPQTPDPKDPETPAMTAAGIATLFITQEYTRPNAGVTCRGDLPNDNIASGIAWITHHFDDLNNLYAFYGLERIGVASGYKFLGTIDWYAQVADKLVKAQAADGTWTSSIPGYPGEGPIDSTAFGILFLARGGSPVMMNKVDYSHTTDPKEPQANWNQRPRDAFNLARWAGTQAEANLNWQVVNLQVSVDELHDAPILYLAGNQTLDLSDGDIHKLRQFVTEGGMILGNADCNNEAFKMSYIELGAKLFPHYEFRALTPDDLIFHQAFKKFRSPPDVWALSNGVRELMVLFPTGDPARYWQTDSALARPDAFGVAFDVFQYAIDSQGLRKKGDTYVVRPDPSVSTTRKVKVARLLVGDNPNPEPGGWPRLAAILHNAPYEIDVQVTPIKSGDDLADYQIVDITGTSKFTLSDDDRTNLLEFAQHGGMLIMDAAGGSGAFADAAEVELKNIFGADAGPGLARPLPASDILYTNPAAPITSFSYRNYAKARLTTNLRLPQLRAIESHHQTVALFSREDLSTGMVGEQVDGIVGYSPDTATAIMRNAVLYTLDQKSLRAMAATMPATMPSNAPAEPIIKVR